MSRKALIIRRAKYALAVMVDAACYIPVLICVVLALSIRLILGKLRRQFKLYGTPRIICLQPGLVRAYRLHGNEIVAHFRCHPSAEILILDPAGDDEIEINPMPGTKIIGWKCSRLSNRLRAVGLNECSILIRELFAISRLLSYSVVNGVHCIRSMQHEFSALRGCLVSKTLSIPHIVDIAGNYEMLRRIWGRTIYFPLFGRAPLLRWFFRQLNDALLSWPLRHAYYVIGRNKNNYEHAFALGVSVERLTLIRIHLAKSFSSSEDSQPPIPERYMLFVARMAKEKFPLDVLLVYQRLAERYPELSLVMIGDGEFLPEIRNRVKTMQCVNRIHILGTRPYEDVIRWTRGAAFAFETYSGSALAEKMICSVPVVAYDIEWMSEIVIENYSGELVRFRNIDDAYHACCRLLDNAQYAQKIAQAGKELALAMFDPEAIARKEKSIFSEALEFSRHQHPTASSPI